MPKRRDSRKIYSAAELIKKINALDAGRKYPQVHIEFFGRREASIDGLCGVLEYDGERIRLSAGKEEIVFCGKGLSIDCLLYTSPSPRDISGSRMPSSA